MVGCGEGVYLASLGRPTDIGLQLGKACYLVAGKGRGECFYFFSFFPFIPIPLSSLSLSFISSTIASVSFHPKAFLWEGGGGGWHLCTLDTCLVCGKIRKIFFGYSRLSGAMPFALGCVHKELCFSKNLYMSLN